MTWRDPPGEFSHVHCYPYGRTESRPIGYSDMPCYQLYPSHLHLFLNHGKEVSKCARNILLFVAYWYDNLNDWNIVMFPVGISQPTAIRVKPNLLHMLFMLYISMDISWIFTKWNKNTRQLNKYLENAYFFTWLSQYCMLCGVVVLHVVGSQVSVSIACSKLRSNELFYAYITYVLLVINL